MGLAIRSTIRARLGDRTVSGTRRARPWAAYWPRLKRIGIQNWRRASTVAGMSRQAFDAQRGVARGIAGRPTSSTQWDRIGDNRSCSFLSGVVLQEIGV